MENYDPQMAARVWQRVKGSQQPENEAAQLQSMIHQAHNAASVYLQLSRRCQGKDVAALHRLSEDAQSQAACLQGIYSLIAGQTAVSHAPSVPQEPPEATLRRCYGKSMQALAQYEQWSSHKEYGPAFARLAQQEQDHCRTLLELLGKRRK